MIKEFKLRFRTIIFIIILILSFYYTFTLLETINLELGNNKLYYYLINSSSSITGDSLNDYYDFKQVYHKLFKVENNKIAYKEEISLPNIKTNNSKVPKDSTNRTKPLVYIYNTHQTETYSTKNLEAYNIVPNVMMTSYILKENLERAGIPTIVEENSVKDMLNLNGWKYAKSYKVTRSFMEEAKNKNPSLKYFIDIHRDSVNKKITTTKINNKSYAKIMMLIGLEHKNYKNNLKEALKIETMLNKSYPGLSRGIYKKSGKGVNGIYNQDFDTYTFLFEVGGSYNDIIEVNNSIEALSKILIKYIGEKNEKV